MRLLHIDTGRELRGGQRQVLILIDALREAGHECTLLARKNGLLAKETTGEAKLSNVWALSRGADLVHVHDARAHTLAALAARAPVVVSRRVAFPVRSSVASRWKYCRAARFIAVSRFVAEQLQEAGVSKDKIDVVYDAVDEPRRRNEWTAAAPAVALASSDPMKGRDLVELAARQANIEVVFSNDLTRDLARASMFVYITRSEGLGSAALLAMSMGVPVIASRVGGLPEVIEEGASGLLVQNDVPEIAQAMRRILAEPQLACSLIRGGMCRVTAKFTKQKLLDGTLQSYTRALAG